MGMLGLCLLAAGCNTDKGVIKMTTVSQVDGPLALDLLNASIQTYRKYAGKPVVPPEGWTYSGVTFTGDDFFLKSTTPQMYGILLTRTAAPGDLMFAFRGTDSVEEWWDDLQVSLTAFTPQKTEVSLPADLKVERGFDKVYQSMKAQLFALLDQSSASTVYVTGHSLGSALSELFVFDLGLSRPELKVVSYNFACPRVGNAAFAQSFAGLPGQADRSTVRFLNSQDIVPKIPLEAEGYVHTPWEFVIDFKEKEGVLPNYLLRHSADNYYRVLQKVLHLENIPATLFGDGNDQLVILNQ